MQRIDENTYIRKTLVTCAEYQLFIDEMRGQGKYYQPDHWTSYQFPEGQTHAPILGVRPSDAAVFCEWLTGREHGKWHYRLPTSDEVERYPLLVPAQSGLGYWIMGLDDDEFSFAWIGNTPMGANILKLPCEYTRTLNRDIDLSIDLAQALLNELQTANIRLSVLGTLINTITLQERIEGLSPAFEGIRIVKERVKI
jgi:hypothetical protein